jgi:hypothetical protein
VNNPLRASLRYSPDRAYSYPVPIGPKIDEPSSNTHLQPHEQADVHTTMVRTLCFNGSAEPEVHLQSLGFTWSSAYICLHAVSICSTSCLCTVRAASNDSSLARACARSNRCGSSEAESVTGQHFQNVRFTRYSCNLTLHKIACVRPKPFKRRLWSPRPGPLAAPNVAPSKERPIHAEASEEPKSRQIAARRLSKRPSQLCVSA